jgi:hypothetical protein
MKRLALFLVLFTQTGCLSQFTSRLDRANEHLEYIRGELARGNAQLADSNERLRQMERHMEDIRQKMATMERFMKRFGGTDAEAPDPSLPSPANQ